MRFGIGICAVGSLKVQLSKSSNHGLGSRFGALRPDFSRDSSHVNALLCGQLSRHQCEIKKIPAVDPSIRWTGYYCTDIKLPPIYTDCCFGKISEFVGLDLQSLYEVAPGGTVLIYTRLK